MAALYAWVAYGWSRVGRREDGMPSNEVRTRRAVPSMLLGRPVIPLAIAHGRLPLVRIRDVHALAMAIVAVELRVVCRCILSPGQPSAPDPRAWLARFRRGAWLGVDRRFRPPSCRCRASGCAGGTRSGGQRCGGRFHDRGTTSHRSSFLARDGRRGVWSWSCLHSATEPRSCHAVTTGIAGNCRDHPALCRVMQVPGSDSEGLLPISLKLPISLMTISTNMTGR
jgi:hypothetical protein